MPEEGLTANRLRMIGALLHLFHAPFNYSDELYKRASRPSVVLPSVIINILIILLRIVKFHDKRRYEDVIDIHISCFIRFIISGVNSDWTD